ncbi:unnamed protein product [Caenorhabditis brenneri]
MSILYNTLLRPNVHLPTVMSSQVIHLAGRFNFILLSDIIVSCHLNRIIVSLSFEPSCFSLGFLHDATNDLKIYRNQAQQSVVL